MAIPVSTFISVPHQKFFDHYIRFCFVKDRPGRVELPKPPQTCWGKG